MPIQRPTFQRPDPPSVGDRPRTRVAVTLGDPNGIGPEVLLKCLHDPELTPAMSPIVIGSPHVLRVHADTLGYSDLTIHVVDSIPESIPDEGVTVLDVTGGAEPVVTFGAVTAEGGRLAMEAVDAAVDACTEGRVDAMVTAPISKDAISQAGYDVPGHTEFIAQKTGGHHPTMMMVAGGLRVEGPLPADGYFATQLDEGFDAVLAMYHDQGLVPFKALAFDHGVNYTAGLPIVRTSPDHGTAYRIAGKGMALPGSMRSAMEVAVIIARHRTSHPAEATA